MTSASPYRNAPMTRIWECGDVIVDLERISLCEWGMSDDDCSCDYDGHEDPHKVLFVYFMGDGAPLELTVSEGQAILAAWKSYRNVPA